MYEYLVTLPNYLNVLDDYRRMYSEFDIKTSVWTKTVIDEVKAQIENLYFTLFSPSVFIFTLYPNFL